MANDQISVMISSRCNDQFVRSDKRKTLSDVRKALKEEIENAKLFGHQIFKVWINEDSPALSAKNNSWEKCMKQAQDSNIFICLYNGNAGWGGDKSGLGICHAELMTAMNTAPGKVRVIELPMLNKNDKQSEHFAKYYKSINLFVRKIDDTSYADALSSIKDAVFDALHDAVINLVKSGVKEASLGRHHLGQALDWARMNYSERINAMKEIGQLSLNLQKTDSIKISNNLMHIGRKKKRIMLSLHAIPDSLSVSEAKNIVGRPFLNDDELLVNMAENVTGPLHIVLCFKTITESQIRANIGHPDIQIVRAPFGYFVAENTYKIQLAFICNCKDNSTTTNGLARMVDWIEQSEESELIAKRAKSRKNILLAIAKEKPKKKNS